MENQEEKMNLNESSKKKIPPTRSLNTKNIAKIFIGIVIALFAISFLFRISFPKKEKIEKTEETEFFQKGNTDELKDKNYSNREVIEAVDQKLIETTTDEEIEVEDLPTPVYEEVKLTPEEEFLKEQELEKLKRKFKAREASFKPSSRTSISSNSSSEIVGMSSSYNDSNKDYMNYITAGIEGSSDPNMQKRKKEYLKNAAVANFVLKEALTPSITKYEVKAGTFIPITLVPTILSDLPGQISAIVREDVYDTLTGTEKLIPMGSKLFGEYNSELSWGQERVQVVFTRLMLPNGKSINLGSMVGGDGIGQSGMTGKVDMRLGKVIGSIIMAGVVGGMNGVLTNNGDDDKDKNAALSGAGEASGAQIVTTVDKYTSKILDVQPRIEVPFGKRGTLLVDQDIILEKYNPEINYLMD